MRLHVRQAAGRRCAGRRRSLHHRETQLVEDHGERRVGGGVATRNDGRDLSTYLSWDASAESIWASGAHSGAVAPMPGGKATTSASAPARSTSVGGTYSLIMRAVSSAHSRASAAALYVSVMRRMRISALSMSRCEWGPKPFPGDTRSSLMTLRARNPL